MQWIFFGTLSSDAGELAHVASFLGFSFLNCPESRYDAQICLKRGLKGS